MEKRLTRRNKQFLQPYLRAWELGNLTVSKERWVIDKISPKSDFFFLMDRPERWWNSLKLITLCFGFCAMGLPLGKNVTLMKCPGLAEIT